MKLEDEYAKAKLDSAGRLVLPAAFREALGLKPGDWVSLKLDAEEQVVRLQSYTKSLRDIQELVRKYVPEGVSLVDEFIQERRAEAAREEEESQAALKRARTRHE